MGYAKQSSGFEYINRLVNGTLGIDPQFLVEYQHEINAALNSLGNGTKSGLSGNKFYLSPDSSKYPVEKGDLNIFYISSNGNGKPAIKADENIARSLNGNLKSLDTDIASFQGIKKHGSEALCEELEETLNELHTLKDYNSRLPAINQELEKLHWISKEAEDFIIANLCFIRKE